MASENVVTLNPDNWESEVIQSGTPFLVDFWAEWCTPCKAIGPTIDQIADENVGTLKVGKVDVAEHQDLAARYEVKGIPLLMLFKEGKIVERITGAKGKSAYLDVLGKHLD